MGSGRLKASILAIIAFAALTINAQAESCSHRLAYCKSVNRTESPGPEGQARCEAYFQTCMHVNGSVDVPQGHNNRTN
jgi:hypothetical protein